MQAALNPLLQGECRLDAGFHFHSVRKILIVKEITLTKKNKKVVKIDVSIPLRII
jgi:hypothetical protein